MPGVKIKKTDSKSRSNSFEGVWRRFKRSCERAGILGRLREVEYFEPPTSERKRKRAAAVKRNQKRISKEREALGMVSNRRRRKKRKTTGGRS